MFIPVLSFVEFHDMLTDIKLGTVVIERILGGSAKMYITAGQHLKDNYSFTRKG